MTQVKNRNQPLVPRYAVVPLAMSVILNMVAYYLGRLITYHWPHHDLTTAIDRAIPFVPAAIVIYLLAFVFWVVTFVAISRDGRETCFRLLAGEHIAKLLCLVIFLIFPTRMARPEVAGRGVFAWLTRLIYRLDTPDMLFPSIHCMDSWFCFRGAMQCKSLSKRFRAGCLVCAVLVFASVLLVKQHFFADVLGGIAVLELGLFLSKRLRAWRIYDRLIPKESAA